MGWLGGGGRSQYYSITRCIPVSFINLHVSQSHVHGGEVMAGPLSGNTTCSLSEVTFYVPIFSLYRFVFVRSAGGNVKSCGLGLFRSSLLFVLSSQ